MHLVSLCVLGSYHLNASREACLNLKEPILVTTAIYFGT